MTRRGQRPTTTYHTPASARRDDDDLLIVRFSELTRDAIQDALEPLTERLRKVEQTIERFNEDRVTKADLAALRADMESMRVTAYPREVADQMRAQLSLRIDETARDVKDMKDSAISQQQRFWVQVGGIGGLIAVAFTAIQHLSFH